ncbi:MAG: serine hydrolase [Bacteroidota bacterium]
MVIEKISGMPYEDYVKFALLEPLGIYDMRIGKNFANEKFSNEVSYYDKSTNADVYSFNGSGEIVPQAYGGNNIELLGAAGGWIASAVELMKFMVAIDGFNEKADILKPETIKLMTDISLNGSTLIGWKGTDGHGNWWRTGTLSGTTALILRQRNNINWVMLLNTTTKRRSRIHSDMSRLMFTSVSGVSEWPSEDLFNFYEPQVFHAQVTAQKGKTRALLDNLN